MRVEGYDLSLTIPGETVSTWSSADADALLTELAVFYDDSNLKFSVFASADVSGVLVIVVKVIGFSTETSAFTSYDFIASGQLLLSSSQFASVTATASAPSIGCSAGYSIPSSSSENICTETDGCLAVNLATYPYLSN
jgi:hypothetical protein